MISVIILSLVALSAAVPELEQKIQQEPVHDQKQPILPEHQPQVPDDVNVIPFYKQIYNPYSLNLYGGYPKDRNYYGYSQKNRDYPLSMSYPYRNNFYLRYLNKLQPKVYYDSQDIYDYQDYVNQPLPNIPGYNHISRKSNANLDSSYDLPYSPAYDSQYNSFDQGYPVDKYYGKNLDLGYSTPSSNIYAKLRDLEFMRRYFGRNLNVERNPVNFPAINWGKKLSSDEGLNLGHSTLEISRNLESGLAKPTIPINDVDIELVKPTTSKNIVLGFGHPQTFSRNLDLEDLRNSNEGLFWDQEYNIKPSIYNVHGKNWGIGNGRNIYGRSSSINNAVSMGKPINGQLDVLPY